jgi:hypothetical protein
MSPWYDLPAEERYGEGAMAGDMAEEAVRRVCEEQFNRPVVDFGPKRTPTERAQQVTWPEIVRYAPDFLQFGRFIEVQGSGNGGYVVFKEKKLDAMVYWNAVMPVWFGIYSSRDDTVTFVDLNGVLWSCQHPDTVVIMLDEGKRSEQAAYKVPLTVLENIRYNDAFAARKAGV